MSPQSLPDPLYQLPPQGTQRNNYLSELLSIAAHEFRTPLTTILSSVDLIEICAQPDQQATREKHLARIRNVVLELNGFIDDLLSLDRLEQGCVEVRPELFNLENFLRELVAESGGIASRNGQQICLSCNGAPGICQDPQLLRLILRNLLSNALKYSREGGQVWLRAHVSSRGCRVSVADEGIGIPTGSRKLLFGRYFRAENAVHIPGTGLGLSIVKRYVELLEGRVSFRSVENRGSDFVVQLPHRLRA
ncbi:sensor histidine kinase [Flaviaesturariibacter aridisoli]|uniref:histidine kinase n=1 Tax=Flaviaesturariibacter aridisoli TaxID=2545761 RepID=A0A4R4E6M3_9BACT|nr:HAMP domain-containing sensor histidine kinase [Flaviaesturariibacter aridisoli]TCZ73345.1 HAMP domain-containing histidine kinase [Flaviaesturariibacter aridisoli]